jgi:hypothetical protein
MPLINFRTNLTSLKYGDPTTGDRPGGGSSGQPYVQFPIDDGKAPDPFGTYYSNNRTSLDFPIRGGAISELVDVANSTISSRIDTARIEKFFKDAPRGTAFVQKQIGLGLTNPRTQVPQALEFAGFTLGNVVLPTTQTYDPLNTLAQIGVSGTGLHFNKHGIAPTIYENPKQTYQYYAGAPVNNQANNNRLTVLRALKLVGTTDFIGNAGVAYNLGIDPSLVDRLGISMIQDQLFNYSGGPQSVYGIGFTRISKATSPDGVALTSEPTVDPVEQIAYSTIGMTYQQLASQDQGRGLYNAYPTPQDFRSYVNENVGDTGIDQPTFDYQTDSIENRLRMGNPGGVFNGRSMYTNVNANGQDQLNMQSPFYYDTTAANGDPWSAAGADSTTDIIKFTFECLDNDNPGFAMGLVFRAFLEGQITDNHSAEYNSFKYLGRGETFRTYQGFNRSMNFTFKIAAQSRQEMRPLYTKLNHLISQVYPDYSSGTNLMRGNVVKLTIGDYIYRMPGFLENVNVSIDNSNTPWEIVLGQFDENDMRQIPHFVTVSCTFLPILDILPRRENKENPRVELIVNRDFLGSYDNKVKRPIEPATPIPLNTNQPATPGITPAPVNPLSPAPPIPKPVVHKKAVKKKGKIVTAPIKQKQEFPNYNFASPQQAIRDNTRIAANGLISGMGTAGGF